MGSYLQQDAVSSFTVTKPHTISKTLSRTSNTNAVQEWNPEGLVSRGVMGLKTVDPLAGSNQLVHMCCYYTLSHTSCRSAHKNQRERLEDYIFQPILLVCPVFFFGFLKFVSGLKSYEDFEIMNTYCYTQMYVTFHPFRKNVQI